MSFAETTGFDKLLKQNGNEIIHYKNIDCDRGNIPNV
jgi:hypothetical protein